MIIEYGKVENLIVNWIKDYLRDNGKDGIVYCPTIRYVWEIPNDISTLFNKWCDQYAIKYYKLEQDSGEVAINELRKFADTLNYIVVHGLSKDDVEHRKYKKDQVGDLLPLADLYTSEIFELCEFGDSPNTKEIEWVSEENNKYNIISSDTNPTKCPHWAKYTIRQKELIAKYHQREKLTRHKTIIRPICEIRKINGLVR